MKFLFVCLLCMIVGLTGCDTGTEEIPEELVFSANEPIKTTEPETAEEGYSFAELLFYFTGQEEQPTIQVHRYMDTEAVSPAEAYADKLLSLAQAQTYTWQKGDMYYGNGDTIVWADNTGSPLLGWNFIGDRWQYYDAAEKTNWHIIPGDTELYHEMTALVTESWEDAHLIPDGETRTLTEMLGADILDARQIKLSWQEDGETRTLYIDTTAEPDVLSSLASLTLSSAPVAEADGRLTLTVTFIPQPQQVTTEDATLLAGYHEGSYPKFHLQPSLDRVAMYSYYHLAYMVTGMDGSPLDNAGLRAWLDALYQTHEETTERNIWYYFETPATYHPSYNTFINLQSRTYDMEKQADLWAGWDEVELQNITPEPVSTWDEWLDDETLFLEYLDWQKAITAEKGGTFTAEYSTEPLYEDGRCGIYFFTDTTGEKPRYRLFVYSHDSENIYRLSAEVTDSTVITNGDERTARVLTILRDMASSLEVVG